MKSEDIQQHLELQLALLKKEKAADYAFYQERMMNKAIDDRKKNGVSWYPISITNHFISSGELLTIEIQKKTTDQNKNAFQVGMVVGLFAGAEDKEKIITGVISYLKEEKMRIILNQSYLPDWIDQHKLGVNLLFDDGTYHEMNHAINTVLKASNNRISELRDTLYGLKKASFGSSQAYGLPSLNEVQNRAFSKIKSAIDVAFVHGPPGTGKTTTLVKCIKEVVRIERQVLVCAPSNAAVDLLVERLVDEGVNTLRLGHPARLTPNVIENSLDVKMSKHPDFHRLKEMRKQSDEYRSMAEKYKRNFGQLERKQRNLLFKESKALKRESRELEDYITEIMLDKAEVISCTITGASHRLIKGKSFKTVFIDESSQALEAAIWIPILRAHRVIMSGDHHQLPPTIKSIEAAKEGLSHTLFAKGIENQPEGVTMLEEQYRMHPEIMGFSSQKFYGGKLRASQNILDRPNPFEIPIGWVDTAGAGYDEKEKKETLSTFNEEEARLLIELLEMEKIEDRSVGIITPYRAQIELLTKEIRQSSLLTPFMEQIDINSVDAFQGQERDIIYISLVRSNLNGEIGFLKEYRRMNVAMTRARYRLVIIGDSATIAQDTFFGEMLSFIQKKGQYQSVFELLHKMNSKMRLSI